MRLATFIAGILVATSALCTERMTYTYGSHVISNGDTMTRVIEILGEPFSREAVTNRYGAQYATYWYYAIDGKQVRLLIVEGKVKSIDESR